MAFLEHVNITVADAQRTANMFVTLFGWKIRWQGSAIHNGFTIHVGTEQFYLAIYTPPKAPEKSSLSTSTLTGLNHVGIVVNNLHKIETQVRKMGFKTFGHNDYEPGSRFYFKDHDGLEIEVISYL